MAISPVLSPFVVLAVSLFVVRVGPVGLRMTGPTPEPARFQAASAFSGAGFTTQESEHAVSTPERRAIVKRLSGPGAWAR